MSGRPNSFHRRHTCSKLNNYEYIILVFGTVGLCFSLAVAIYTITKTNESDQIVFPIIAIICSIFTVIYLYRGVFEERSYELMLYVISAVSLMFYIIISFINIFQYKKADIDLLIEIRLGVSILIIPLTAIIGTVLAYNYNVRGTLIFYTVGGIEELQECCKNVFVFQALLQLDFQFELCVIVLCIGLNNHLRLFQYIVLSFGIPFSIIWRIVGFFSVRYEKRVGSYLFFIFGFIEPSYIIYIIYKTVVKMKSIESLIYITFACCSLSLLVRISLLLMHTIVHRKFGIGLKEKLNNSSTMINNSNGYGSTNSLLRENNQA